MIWVPAALAAPASLDVELFHPTVGPDAVQGVASPGWQEPTLAAALSVGYSHDALVLDREVGVVSSVVRSRLATEMVAVWQPGRWFGAELAVPLYADWGTETPEDGADRFGNGDLRLVGRVGPLVRGPLQLGGRVDLAVPIGIREAWMGEENVRFTPSVVARVAPGRLSFSGELGMTVRGTQVETTAGLDVGHEVRGAVGAGLELWPEHARASLALLTRNGLVADPGNHAFELVAGLEFRPLRALRTTVVLGRGVSAGYGAPDLRLGVVLQYTPREAEVAAPVPVVVDADDDFEDRPDPTPPPPPEEPDEEPTETEAPQARVVSDEIVILRPIRFERGTAKVLPESLPTLVAVAKVLNSHAEILHLVIEGHASEEGGYAYNYELSMARASAVYRELVNAGVYPERLSCRSAGEVEARGDAAANRRVVFRITEWLPPGSNAPVYPPEILAPWSGEKIPIVTPPPPPPPPPAPTTMPDLLEDE